MPKVKDVKKPKVTKSKPKAKAVKTKAKPVAAAAKAVKAKPKAKATPATKRNGYTRMGVAAAARAVASRKPLPIREIYRRVGEKLGLPPDRVAVAVGGQIYENPKWTKSARGVYQYTG